MTSTWTNHKHGSWVGLLISAGGVCLILAMVFGATGVALADDEPPPPDVAAAEVVSAPDANQDTASAPLPEAGVAEVVGAPDTSQNLAGALPAEAPPLGEAGAFSVLAPAGVTNTGNSVLEGGVGADSSIIGFTDSPSPGPGIAAELVFAPQVDQAQADAQAADLFLTSQAGDALVVLPDLTGQTFGPGVYGTGSALLTGVLTLDSPGVYIFLVDSNLTSSGSVSLINGSRPCDVYWHVTSDAAITGGSFVGTIIAGTSVTLGEGASLDGRALALTGTVTLINNSITGPTCDIVSPPETPPTTASTDTSTTTDLGTTGTDSLEGTAPPETLPIFIAETGADLVEARAFASRQGLRLGLVAFGLGLVFLGITLKHKPRA